MNKLDHLTDFTHGTYPHLHAFIRDIIDNHAKILDTKLVNMHALYGEEFCRLAEHLLDIVTRMNKPAFDSFLDFTVDYMREQIHFDRSGNYGHGTFEEIYDQVYGNSEIMEGFYFVGLFLAYAFMVVPYEKLQFYNHRFLPALPIGSRGIEIGYGHGLYMLAALERTDAIIKGFDISPFSVGFATEMLHQAGIPTHRFELLTGDILKGLNMQKGSTDWFVFTEVMEHLPEPDFAFQEIRRGLKPDGLLYTTTVIDTNHMDHMINFENDRQVDELILRNGFKILDKKIIVLRDIIPDCRDKTVGLAYVCRS